MILIPRYLIALAFLLITACLCLSGLTLWLTEKRIEGMEVLAVPNVTNYNFYHGAEAVIQQFPDARIDGEIEKKKGEK